MSIWCPVKGDAMAQNEGLRPSPYSVFLHESCRYPVIVAAGPAAVERFLESFAAQIANARTRAAYARAAGQFLSWCAARGLGLRAIAPLHVAAYIRTHPGSAPTVKQHLAAIRVLCDWLVIHQVLPVNPAAAVRGPKHVVTKGATPVLTPAETRSLLDGIDPGSLVGLRDLALLSVMVYSFARVSAVVGMRRQDYFLQGTRGWLRLHEKGGKRHDVPAHHRAEAAVDAYLVAGGIEDAKALLFQSVDRSRRLSGRSLTRRVVLAMIKRRAAAAGLPASTCLPHVPGDGHHGVSVERGDARAGVDPAMRSSASRGNFKTAGGSASAACPERRPATSPAAPNLPAGRSASWRRSAGDATGWWSCCAPSRPRPAALALARPSRVRSEIRSRSTSANSAKSVRGPEGEHPRRGQAVERFLEFSRRRSPTPGRARRMRARRGGSCRGVRLGAWACARSPRCTWRPISARIRGRRRR